jgi:hypothetical protein
MKRDRHFFRKRAWTLTLAVAALLLPASLAHAGGHGGGHAGGVRAGASTHHGHRPFATGYGWTYGGYYPYGGYNPFYGGYNSFYGGYSDFGGYNGVVATSPYLGVYTPFGGAAFDRSVLDDVADFMGSFTR